MALKSLSLVTLAAKESPKLHVEYGGYNYEFIGETYDRHNCQICTKVLRDPHLAVCCGKHFCESCLEEWFKKQRGKKTCPTCRAEGLGGKGFNHVINKGLRSEIEQLKIKCSNHSKGCTWTGEMCGLKAHLENEKGCGFVVVECPQKCRSVGFNVWVTLRHDLEKHLQTECSHRPYRCEHCGLKDTFENITGKSSLWMSVGAHYDKCQEIPLPCPNKCGTDGIKRKNMDSHHSTCPQQYVDCPFAEAGCKIEIHRHELSNHIVSYQQQHLLLMMVAYKQMKDRLQDTEARLTAAIRLLSLGKEADKKAVSSIIGRSSYLFKSGDSVKVTLSGVSEYQSTGKIWKSQPFYFREGYKMCLEVRIKEIKYGVSTTLSAKICLLKGELDDQLKWPVVCPYNEQCSLVKCIHPTFVATGTGQCVRFKVCSMQRGAKGTNDEEMSCIRSVNDSFLFDVEFAFDCTLKVSIRAS